MRSVTRFIFVTTQVFALIWISASYILAGYATIALGEVFPATELSQQVVITILGSGVLKVVENVFEHNDGGFFGHSSRERSGGDEQG